MSGSNGTPLDRRCAEKSMLLQNILRLLVYFALAAHLSSANADPTDPTQESKAEAALAGKIKCEDFRKNPDGTWTSGPNVKIGSSLHRPLVWSSAERIQLTIVR